MSKSVALHLMRGTTGWEAIVGGKPESFDASVETSEQMLLSLEFNK